MRLGEFVKDLRPADVGEEKIQKLRKHVQEWLEGSDRPDELFQRMVGLRMRELARPGGFPPFTVAPVNFCEYTEGLYCDVDFGARQLYWCDESQDWIEFSEIEDAKTDISKLN